MKLFIIIILAVLFACSCAKVTKYEHDTFAQYSYDDPVYLNELAKIMKSGKPEDFKFFFDKYLSKNGKDYIILKVLNDSIEARGLFLVENRIPLANIISSKGVSYSGVEFINLKYEIETDSVHNSYLVFKGVEKILD